MATILDIAASSDDFNILVATVGFIDTEIPDANLAETLDTPDADLTVFAPTDAAFTQLALDLGFAGDPSSEAEVTTFLTTALTAETLLDVVLYHVSAGAKTLETIQSDGTVETLEGGTITSDGPTLVDQEPDLIDPSVAAPDIVADNGIIHGIDRVLLPFDLEGNDAPTITGIVADSGGEFDTISTDFDLLLNSLQAAGLDGVLDDTAGDFTVFAPNDAAFVSLAQTLGFVGTDEGEAFTYIVESLSLLSGGGDPIPLLTDILLYHVSGESLQASQVLSAETIPTLLGADLGVDGATLVDADPDIANPNLIATDIQAANGVVHVLDGVLIPADLLQSDGSNDVDFVIGDATDELIRTGRDADLIDGNAGNDEIFAGAGDDLIIGGAGNDNIFGGKGADVFVFEEGSEIDRIFGFEFGADKIDVSAFGLTFDELESMIHNDGRNTRIDLGDGDEIVVRNSDPSDFSENDFIFV